MFSAVEVNKKYLKLLSIFITLKGVQLNINIRLIFDDIAILVELITIKYI